MPKVYTEVDKDTTKLIARMIDHHHPNLKKAGVTICALFVAEYADGERVEASTLKHHGYAAHAVIKRNGYKDRVEGKQDATLIIDEFSWSELGPASRAALIDHELLHLEVVEKDGALQRDEINRPVLRIRKHDFEIGGFYTICERHKKAALEHSHLSQVAQTFIQMELPFSVG